MKLNERVPRKRGPKATEVLEPTPLAEAVFDIRRDVSPRDWERISKEVTERFGRKWAASQEILAEQLVVLGSENRTTTDLDAVCAGGLAEAQRQFQVEVERLPETEFVAGVAEPLVPWLIIAPEDIPDLLAKELSPELQTQMWEYFDKYFHLNTSIIELGLVLWLLFPDQHERIKRKCDLALFTKSLEDSIAHGADTEVGYHLALFASIIFPGQFKDLVTPELVRQMHVGNPRECLNRLGIVDLLSAEQVSVDDQGEIRIERQKTGLARHPELPARPQL